MGKDCPDRGAWAWGPLAVLAPCPALLPVWHSHLASIWRGLLVVPHCSTQAWYCQADISAEMWPLPGPSSTHPWWSVHSLRVDPSTLLSTPIVPTVRLRRRTYSLRRANEHRTHDPPVSTGGETTTLRTRLSDAQKARSWGSIDKLVPGSRKCTGHH